MRLGRRGGGAADRPVEADVEEDAAEESIIEAYAFARDAEVAAGEAEEMQVRRQMRQQMMQIRRQSRCTRQQMRRQMRRRRWQMRQARWQVRKPKHPTATARCVATRAARACCIMQVCSLSCLDFVLCGPADGCHC